MAVKIEDTKTKAEAVAEVITEVGEAAAEKLANSDLREMNNPLMTEQEAVAANLNA